MQYIQGTTTVEAMAAPIAMQNELNRLRRDNAKLMAEIDALRQLMYATQKNGDENADIWYKMFFNTSCRNADIMHENEELRAALAAFDHENAELKSALLKYMMKRGI